MKIKNIIFDLGGVIIDIEPQLSLQAFARHSKQLADTSVYRHRIFYDFETGAIDTELFRKEIRTAFGLEMDDMVMDECMNAMLGKIPQDRLDVLEKMKSRYKTVLLSNTNPIHYLAISRYVQQAFGNKKFDDFFHKTYYSHLVGMRKPDVRIFEMLLKENEFVPQETLYLDDLGEHLKSARSLGIQTVKVTPENHILKILKDF